MLPTCDGLPFATIFTCSLQFPRFSMQNFVSLKNVIYLLGSLLNLEKIYIILIIHCIISILLKVYHELNILCFQSLLLCRFQLSNDVDC